MGPPTGAAPAERAAPLPPPSSAARRRRLLALVLGLALLAWVIVYSGPASILERLRILGWHAPLILVPYLIVNIFDTFGWRRTLPPAAAARVPFHSLYLSRMAGEAVNSVTPTAAVGGEPVKAHLLRGLGVDGSDSVASVVIAKTALTVSQIAFTLLGLAALFDRLGQRASGAVWMVLLLVLAVGFSAFLVRLQRRGLVATVWRWLHRIAPRSAFVGRLQARAQEIDARLADFYALEGRAFRGATLWHFGGWLLGVFEVWLIMALIGAPLGLRDALIIEGLAQPIRAVSIIIPGGIGAYEAGGVALCVFLGIPEGTASTFWLLKRGRELVFDGVGIIYLTRRTSRRHTA